MAAPAAQGAMACRYLAYEKALEELHVLRKAAAPSQQQTDASLEAAIPRRIHFIFERATRRFKGELRFWHAWLGWCEASHGSKRFSRVRHCPASLDAKECMNRQTDRTTAVLQLLQQAECQGMQTHRVKCQLSSIVGG